jgi:uncharacterized metal-binding protein
MVASGRDHDRATWWLAMPFGLLWWPQQGVAAAMAAGLAFLIGGLLLSPDLDTHSRPTARWGVLKVLWWPYRRLLRHRSLLSHSPLLGTAGRLAYLGGVVGGLAALVHPLGGPSAANLWERGLLIWEQHRGLVLAAVVGVEASAWLHLIQDGDPMPRLPRLLRR